MAGVFVLHDLGSSHVGSFDSCLFTFCQSHNALHAPGKILFKTLTFFWRELGQACPNIAQIPGSTESFEAVGKPQCKVIHVEIKCAINPIFQGKNNPIVPPVNTSKGGSTNAGCPKVTSDTI